MAHTYVVRSRDASSKARRIVDITLVDNYATGGWALAPQDVGLGRTGVIDRVVADPVDGYLIRWDATNQKLVVFQGDNTNAAAAPGIQLPNASAAMAGKVIRVEVVGQGAG